MRSDADTAGMTVAVKHSWTICPLEVGLFQFGEWKQMRSYFTAEGCGLKPVSRRRAHLCLIEESTFEIDVS